MDRYLGMSFSYNPDTGAMTASMYHSVLKLLATFCTSSLPEQSTPYTMDLFDISEDLTPVDPKSYQRLVGGTIWLLKLRFETQLAVIMACSHNDSPTQGDLTKAICFLAYLKGAADLGPTWYTEDGPILIASCDAAFAVHPDSGGSQLSISFRIGRDNVQDSDYQDLHQSHSLGVLSISNPIAAISHGSDVPSKILRPWRTIAHQPSAS
jgi:hypothetical protein